MRNCSSTGACQWDRRIGEEFLPLRSKETSQRLSFRYVHKGTSELKAARPLNGFPEGPPEIPILGEKIEQPSREVAGRKHGASVSGASGKGPRKDCRKKEKMGGNPFVKVWFWGDFS